MKGWVFPAILLLGCGGELEVSTCEGFVDVLNACAAEAGAEQLSTTVESYCPSRQGKDPSYWDCAAEAYSSCPDSGALVDAGMDLLDCD